LTERRYRQPPIVEAACEFQFGTEDPWDVEVPDKAFEMLRNQYPVRRQAKRTELRVSATADQIEQQVQQLDLSQFVRQDPNVLVQMGQGFLAINHLKPYTSWHEFQRLIRHGLEVYLDVAKPTQLQRIGLRYINRIEFHEPTVALHRYFQFYPFVGSGLPQTHGPFIVGIQVPYDGSRDVLKLMLTNAKPESPEGPPAAILDIEYGLVEAHKITLAEAFDWASVAHERIEATFEACITDVLRQQFEEEPAQ